VAVLLVALGGCGDEPEAEPATVPVPGTSSADPVPSGSAASKDPAGFAAVVQRELPELVLDHRDDEILALAQHACTALAAGRSAGAVEAEVRAFGTDRAGARELVRLAITTVCPEQERRLDEF
jgi:hypothetical protein